MVRLRDFLQFSFWRRTFSRVPAVAPMVRVVMFTRSGCHLCDAAWERLVGHQKQRGFFLEKIDVDTAPDLVAKYGNCVPVILVNDVVRFRGRLNEVLLRRLLDAEA